MTYMDVYWCIEGVIGNYDFGGNIMWQECFFMFETSIFMSHLDIFEYVHVFVC